MPFVYILECSDKTYYTGSAKNLEERIKKHNEKKGAKYTRGRTPVKLLYYEELDSMQSAYKRESEIKKMKRHEKKILIKAKRS